LPLNARADEVALQLGEHNGHVRHHLAHRRTGVHPISVTIMPPALFLGYAQQSGEVLGAAAGSVDPQELRVLVQCDPTFANVENLR
jgi:hypothetical protein